MYFLRIYFGFIWNFGSNGAVAGGRGGLGGRERAGWREGRKAEVVDADWSGLEVGERGCGRGW